MAIAQPTDDILTGTLSVGDSSTKKNEKESEYLRKRRESLRQGVVALKNKGYTDDMIKRTAYEKGAFDVDEIENELGQYNRILGIQNPQEEKGGFQSEYSTAVREAINNLGAESERNGALGAIAALKSQRDILGVLDKGVETGPLAGPKQKLEARYLDKGSDDFVNFNAATTAFTANFIKALSGVQVSDKEREFLMNALPSPDKQERENRLGMEQLTNFLKNAYEFKLGTKLDVDKLYGTDVATEASGEAPKKQETVPDESQLNPNAPSRLIDPETGEMKMNGFFDEAQQERESVNATQEAAGKAGEFLGVKKFGEGIGTSLFLQTPEGKDLQDRAASGDQEALKTLQQILDEAPTAKELIGSAALTALNTISGGLASKGATMLSNAASKAGLAGKAAKAVGMIGSGAGTGYAYDLAGGLEQNQEVSEAAKPGVATSVGVAIPLVGIFKNAMSKGLEKGAERIYGSAVSGSLEDTKKAILYNGKTLPRELLDRGIAGGKEKLLRKATQGVNSNEEKLQELLSASTEVIKREELLPFMEKVKERLSKTATPRAKSALQSVDEAINLLPEEMSLSEANQWKRNLYTEVGDLAYKMDAKLGADAENAKAIAKGLRTLIEKKSGSSEVAAVNKELSTFGKLQDSTLESIAKTLRNKLAGVGTWGAIIEKTLGSTALKTYGAKVIDRAAKKLEKVGTGAKSKVTKTVIMNAIREAQDEEN